MKIECNHELGDLWRISNVIYQIRKKITDEATMQPLAKNHINIE